MNTEKIIELLKLSPHPEGGFYRETYRSEDSLAKAALPARYTGPREISTAIYYLLEAGNFSALHRVQSDEIFHFYLGDPVELFTISSTGTGQRTIIGPDIGRGQRPQVQVPKDTWQGLRVAAVGAMALLGATVAPGFAFDDFEMGDRATLIGTFPDLVDDIETFTRSSAPAR